jgi:hypothetical protein
VQPENPRLQLLGSGGFSPRFPNIPPALVLYSCTPNVPTRYLKQTSEKLVGYVYSKPHTNSRTAGRAGLHEPVAPPRCSRSETKSKPRPKSSSDTQSARIDAASCLARPVALMANSVSTISTRQEICEAARNASAHGSSVHRGTLARPSVRRIKTVLSSTNSLARSSACARGVLPPVGKYPRAAPRRWRGRMDPSTLPWSDERCCASFGATTLPCKRPPGHPHTHGPSARSSSP